MPDGTPCCDWVGEDGAGHFVKMVHNGIEYGDMQLICEAYHLLTAVLGMSEAEIGDVFRGWNKGILESFLIEITGNILAYLDEDGRPLLRKILDTASQKGTGKWTAVTALQEGTPLTLIGEAVFARFLFRHQRSARGGIQCADRSQRPPSTGTRRSSSAIWRGLSTRRRSSATRRDIC